MPEEVIQKKQEKIATKAPMSPVTIALMVGVFIIIIVLAFVYMNIPAFRDEMAPLPDEIPVAQSDTTVAPPSDSLGGEIYEKQQNPLEDKLPEQTPVANPIGDAYKNPFE
jgi:hypothetical protein